MNRVAASSGVKGEVFFEHVGLGGFAKCTAIHGATGVEATVTGPVTAARFELERLALRALERRLEREGARKT